MTWPALSARTVSALFNRFGEHAVLHRAGVLIGPCRVIVDHSAIDANGITYRGTVLAFRLAEVQPRPGDTVVLGVRAYRLDAVVQDDGNEQRWVTMPGQVPA